MGKPLWPGPKTVRPMGEVSARSERERVEARLAALESQVGSVRPHSVTRSAIRGKYEAEIRLAALRAQVEVVRRGDEK